MRAMPRFVVRREGGLYAYEKALERAGLTPVAGADEAGRGACAGPLVVAAVVLPTGRRGQVPGLADSKLLTPRGPRRGCTTRCVRPRGGVVGRGDPGRRGRPARAARLQRRGDAAGAGAAGVTPSYVLTDGFPVRGLPAPGLAVWKGDRVSASIAAASVVAKVTRDRIMARLHERWPAYDFLGHKGYVTPVHSAALDEHGPCPEHRFSYVNVARRVPGDQRVPARTLVRVDDRELTTSC